MITIQIPAWVQWAAFGLAVAYALPRALRATIVAVVWLLSLLRGRWPVRTQPYFQSSTEMYKPVPLKLVWDRVRDSLLMWALGIGLMPGEERWAVRERLEEARKRDAARSAADRESGST